MQIKIDGNNENFNENNNNMSNIVNNNLLDNENNYRFKKTLKERLSERIRESDSNLKKKDKYSEKKNLLIIKIMMKFQIIKLILKIIFILN